MLRVRGNAALHLLDRYTGIPAVLALGSLRRRRKLPTKIGAIGLLKSGAIGDTVLMSGVIADLRRTFPQASLVLFSGESNFEIACMLDGLTRVVRVPAGNPMTVVKILRSEPVDVMLDFGQWSRAEAVYSIASKSAFTVGFRTKGQYRHYGYDLTVEHSAETHELENYHALVQALGVKAESLPHLRVLEANPVALPDYAVCHLWPGGKNSHLKEWPLENWRQLFRELRKRGLEVVLTGAPSDRTKNENLIASLPPELCHQVLNTAGLNLPKTAALLAGARLVVSVNTGIMHMAAALGNSIVGLQGPTSSKRWGPLGEKAIAVDSILQGCGYLDLGWEYPKNPPACMEAISFESVVAACDVLLASELRPRAVLNATRST